MIALIQRVKRGAVAIDKKTVAEISQGLVVLIAFAKRDSSEMIPSMVNKILNYRVFSDDNDKMNLSVRDLNAGLLLVPQFTLCANTQKGLRPSFSPCASPDIAKTWYSELIEYAETQHTETQTGVFGADMLVSIENDGPVSFFLELCDD